MGLRQMTVRLRVPIEDGWRSTFTVQVYTDFGDGSIDTTRPLLGRRVRVFPADVQDAERNPGYGGEIYGQRVYGAGRAVDRPRRGYGFNPYGQVEYGRASRYALIDVSVPQGYGSWKFAAKVYDGAGNAQGALVEFTQFVSGENPPPLSAFSLSSYTKVTDKVVFTI